MFVRLQNIEILISITKELEQEGLLRHPVVALEPGTLGAEAAAKMGEAVRKLGGTAVDSAGECYSRRRQ